MQFLRKYIAVMKPVNPDKYYLSDKPCKNGHVGPRLKSTRQCMECQRAYVIKWRANPANRERVEAMDARSRQAWFAKNGGWTNPAQRARQRVYDRKRRGVPTPPYPAPEFCEAGCGQKLEINSVRTHVDHDHDTGIFRGWICNRCNLGIGLLGDSIEGLRRALTYLETHTANESCGTVHGTLDR